ncbi:hypothetical protein [Virgisporangium aurantiacum]|uniref:Uncharacterized protein n=1 Tax=Virgisporangium aurantiacum TaxID=175570 RepID=A0A8J3Z4V1_9ACTN|nr:hypothetical protein [Virgisporangium aurantiacum]GIJ57559.1 hypothetical protein Vau01_050750 [Virgisporangium aurantiacum]
MPPQDVSPRAAGAATKTAGVVFIALAVVAVLIAACVLPLILGVPVELFVALAIAAPILAVVGGFLYFRGRQLTARSAAPAVLHGDRPRVLYLRPFRTDAGITGQGLSLLLTQTLVTGATTDEEQLAEALKPLGDMIAIGQPGETLPRPGAARQYTTDDEWRDAVVHWMRVARLVVLRAGTDAGLLWELRTARGMVRPERLLILVLDMKRTAYDSFRAEAVRTSGIALPGMPRARYGFFRFASDWTPEFLPLRGPLLRLGFKPRRKLFQFALKPVFDSHRVPWSEPPISALAVVTYAMGALLVLACAVGLLL